MRKILLTVPAILLAISTDVAASSIQMPVPGSAEAMISASDDALLDKIEQKNTAIETIEAHFDQCKTLPSGKKVLSEGTLYFSSPDRMSMIYSVPETDLFLIDGSSLYMARGKSKQSFDTEKNALMRSLSTTLLYCVRGQIRALAEENDAEISVSQTAAGVEVKLTAKKKSTRGYSNIILIYDSKTSVLISMDLVEFTKISTVYQMSGIRTDIAIDDSVYTVPQK